MKTKILKITLKDGSIQKVNFQKHNDAQGWIAVSYDTEKYIPFVLYDSLENMKKNLEKEGLEYEWE